MKKFTLQITLQAEALAHRGLTEEHLKEKVENLIHMALQDSAVEDEAVLGKRIRNSQELFAIVDTSDVKVTEIKETE